MRKSIALYGLAGAGRYKGYYDDTQSGWIVIGEFRGRTRRPQMNALVQHVVSVSPRAAAIHLQILERVTAWATDNLDRARAPATPWNRGGENLKLKRQMQPLKVQSDEGYTLSENSYNEAWKTDGGSPSAQGVK